MHAGMHFSISAAHIIPIVFDPDH